MPDVAPTAPKPIAPQIDPALAGALAAAFGPWGALAGLALTGLLPVIDKVIFNSKNNVPVTPENWAELRALIQKGWDEL